MLQNPFVTVFSPQAEQIIRTDFEIEHWYDGCAFTEGPVWNKEGFYLFSDIPRNVVYKMDGPGAPQVFIDKSGLTAGTLRQLAEQIGSNGLAYDAAGTLYLCQHGNGAIATYDGEALKPLVTHYNGHVFNSPNDLVVHADGTVFFSDPPYGLHSQQLQPQYAQPVAAMYAWRKGVVHLLTDRYQFPNGVCLSPDEKTLFTCSTRPNEAWVLAFDTATFELKGELCKENSDGIKCDPKGNFYLCTKEGLLVLNSRGERMALIPLQTRPSNCCWGGADGTDLFITAQQNIFRIPRLQRA